MHARLLVLFAFVSTSTLLGGTTARAEGTDAEVKAIDRWARENHTFKREVGSPSFSAWWDSLPVRHDRLPVVADLHLLRNVLIQVRATSARRFTPHQLRVIDRKIADLDRRSSPFSSRPRDTRIPSGLVHAIRPYPGTHGAWRGTGSSRWLSRKVSGAASRMKLRTATRRAQAKRAQPRVAPRLTHGR